MAENITVASGYKTVNGLNMYYEIYGQGQPLVLIHGGGSTIETTFGRIIPLLAINRQLIAVELQAHGRSGDREAPESFVQDAADVVELLDQLNVETVDFLGFSNGGQTAMQIAISYPAKVHKLIIASAFYKREGIPAQFWEGMNKATFADMPQAYKDAYIAVNNNPAGVVNMFNKDVERMRNFRDWSDAEVASITAPTLLLSGDKDVALAEHVVAMWRLISNSRLAIIPGEHGKYLGETTTLTNGVWTQQYAAQIIEEFLNGET